MEPSSLLELARNQGPVFWVAAAAVALGATLLVMALAQFVRQRRAGRGAAVDSVEIITPPATPDLDTYVPTTPLLAQEFVPAVPAGAPGGGDHSLALLLRRLQSAGDRLEEVAGDFRPEESDRRESGLKDSLQDVEYVFRASGP